MFGYVKPVKEELLVREYEFYRAAYCGICRAMKHHTGTLSNVSLSYDSVFLALVRMLYVGDEKISAKERRCIAHPMKKRPMLCENEAIEYTARAFAILTYYKLRDDISDEKLLMRLAKSAVRPIASGAKRRAGERPLCELVGEKLDAITSLEREKCSSVDIPASLFGELLGEIFAYGLPEGEKLVPRQVGYHLGKFIYAADAAEDYERDAESGAYNPYVAYYGTKTLSDDNRETIHCALILECKEISAAVNLLPFGSRATIENIINNIIYLGLPKRIEFLLTDKKERTT
ncbi:MAG: hypothetical protein IJW03_04755 [Clostridia bacterium]|nr:hypothetical protein [Clostridia bacterium]